MILLIVSSNTKLWRVGGRQVTLLHAWYSICPSIRTFSLSGIISISCINRAEWLYHLRFISNRELYSSIGRSISRIFPNKTAPSILSNTKAVEWGPPSGSCVPKRCHSPNMWAENTISLKFSFSVLLIWVFHLTGSVFCDWALIQAIKQKANRTIIFFIFVYIETKIQRYFIKTYSNSLFFVLIGIKVIKMKEIYNLLLKTAFG